MTEIEVVSIGTINLDVTLFVKRFPYPGEEMEVLRMSRNHGGTGANSAVATARILGPGKVGLICSLGNDEIGEYQIENLMSEGVEVSGVKRMEEESGQAYIIVDDRGENLIHTYFGANRLLLPEILQDGRIKTLIKNCRILIITDPPIETADLASKMAHEAHSCVLWDPGVHAEEEMERLTPILRNVDYLIPNWLEVEKLTKTRDIHEMGEKMSLVSPTTKIIIKQGSKGATLIGGMEISSVSGFSLEGSGMRAMNTVGCGDAFIGAFAAFKTMRYDDSESIRWANCAGAYNATQPKTRGSPTREQLKDFYRMYYQSKGR